MVEYKACILSYIWIFILLNDAIWKSVLDYELKINQMIDK